MFYFEMGLMVAMVSLVLFSALALIGQHKRHTGDYYYSEDTHVLMFADALRAIGIKNTIGKK